MDPVQFSQLVARVKKASFAKDKVQEVRLIVSGGALFTSAQARELIALSVHKSDQEDMVRRARVVARTFCSHDNQAVLLYRFICDPQNFGDALSACTFSSSKQEVMKRLAL
jgi:hypothetical protein